MAQRLCKRPSFPFPSRMVCSTYHGDGGELCQSILSPNHGQSLLATLIVTMELSAHIYVQANHIGFIVNKYIEENNPTGILNQD